MTRLLSRAPRGASLRSVIAGLIVRECLRSSCYDTCGWGEHTYVGQCPGLSPP